jgi:cytochrome c-type biogenesis protein CcmH/NrfG
MTETLARIYLEQGKYKEALQAYRILILKYPEKSSFFADQIKAVEKLRDVKNKKTP